MSITGHKETKKLDYLKIKRRTGIMKKVHTYVLK